MTVGGTTRDSTVVHVRPKVSLLSNALAAILLGTTPLFAVAYWFAATHGGLLVVGVAHAVTVSFALLLLWRQLNVYCAVTATELIGNGIFTPLVRVPLGRIRRVLLVPTYVGAVPQPVMQLLVTDADGRRVFRMRGNFWHEADLRTLAAALPVPAEQVAEPMTRRDFFRTYPGSAYWFEGSRLLQVALLTVLAIGGLALAVWIMSLLGLPVRF